MDDDAKPVRLLSLHGGGSAIVDDEDFEKVRHFVWRLKKGSTKSYVVYRPAERTGQKRLGDVRLHRLILNAPRESLVDHKNGDTLDNRRCNLRLCTTSQNGANRGKSKNNTSGFKGVYFVKRDNKRPWSVYIMAKRKYMYVGRYDTAEEAARAYDVAAVKHFGEFAGLNFPLG